MSAAIRIDRDWTDAADRGEAASASGPRRPIRLVRLRLRLGLRLRLRLGGQPLAAEQILRCDKINV